MTRCRWFAHDLRGKLRECHRPAERGLRLCDEHRKLWQAEAVAEMNRVPVSAVTPPAALRISCPCCGAEAGAPCRVERDLPGQTFFLPAATLPVHDDRERREAIERARFPLFLQSTPEAP